MDLSSFVLIVDEHIKRALREDITSEDVSTAAVMPEAHRGTVELIAKQDGVIAGLQVFERTFKILDPAARFDASVSDGQRISSGQLLGIVHADVRALLSGERVALNYLQRMSGIATKTRQAVDALAEAGSKTVIVDTRKTTPGMRIFEKEAVRLGGGGNHRFNLSDGVMLKDNHLDAAGGIANAVKAARLRVPFVRKIEVECETLEQVSEAVEAGADIIMLDNMSTQQMKGALSLIDGRAETECSGNVDIDALQGIAALGVDYVSSGALTHSAGILDLSMKHLKVFD
ncbi:MAG: carboxylating nicotinate-nucleotide diphosphorylase [Eggerthellaceae bacterium]|nr:carboxylating nicotinate-nucleotide diphosphorylase [Eggerthellaceae bacterium]